MVRITSLPAGGGDSTMHPVQRARSGCVPPKPVTILIIEDDAATRLALACLVADERYQIVLATSAEDALRRMHEIDPDVILCDFLLDGMNGRQLCERLKASPTWRYVPILVITRVDAMCVVADILRSGASDVLIKPVRGEDLRARVVAALRTRLDYLQLRQESAGLTNGSIFRAHANPFDAEVAPALLSRLSVRA
ncbi:MAG: response regulator [Steroidobacteraceae bacterium]|nr:response regulator [Steroidobacteraceae bacterium]